MLETNVNNLSDGNKSHVYIKTETKGDDIRKEIKDNAIRIISVQSKSLEGHAEKVKENLNCVMKEYNFEKLDHKEEKDQGINAEERMVKTILKLATLKSSFRFNMQLLR